MLTQKFFQIIFVAPFHRAQFILLILPGAVLYAQQIARHLEKQNNETTQYNMQGRVGSAKMGCSNPANSKEGLSSGLALGWLLGDRL